MINVNGVIIKTTKFKSWLTSGITENMKVAFTYPGWIIIHNLAFVLILCHNLCKEKAHTITKKEDQINLKSD